MARKEKNALKLVEYSEQIGDPFELSTVRREDYKFHKGELKSKCECTRMVNL